VSSNLIWDGQGRELAVLVFGAASWKVADRDPFSGWSLTQRRQGLLRINNQQRFLIRRGCGCRIWHGNTQKDWSADCKMFGRSPWEPRELFAPILREAIRQQQRQRILVSVDAFSGSFVKAP